MKTRSAVVTASQRTPAVNSGLVDLALWFGQHFCFTSSDSSNFGTYLVVHGNTLLSKGGIAELSSMLLSDVYETLPAVELEVCLIAEVVVLARDGVIDLEETMFADTERWSESVRHASICTANAVCSRRQISSGEQTKSREEDASIVAESESNLASICSLGEGCDAAAVDVPVIGHSVQGGAHAAHVCGSWPLELVVRIIARNFLQANLLRSALC